ncbi:MAG TPA: type II toxin-antitoxin system VapC family toxin [Candidatus Dormibacteraeota bacterium]|nr:type II toxin-antitoxin system VapC family toxin [Candidatus Dormibacteraeota bacterium]
MSVVDASVVIEWISPEGDNSSPALGLFKQLAAKREELLAPRVLLEEASNALVSGIRRQRWSGAAADSAHALLLQIPIRLADDRRDLLRGWELARRYDNHPVYDMIYVALAERTGSNLITADHALRRRLSHLDWVVGPDDGDSRDQ